MAKIRVVHESHPEPYWVPEHWLTHPTLGAGLTPADVPRKPAEPPAEQPAVEANTEQE